jgi:hypothetical protein
VAKRIIAQGLSKPPARSETSDAFFGPDTSNSITEKIPRITAGRSAANQSVRQKQKSGAPGAAFSKSLR